MPPEESPADEAARQAGGDFESRIIHRAAALPVSSPIRDALRSVGQVTAWSIAALLIIAAITGAGAARAALGAPRDEPVNFFWILTSLLGVQTLLLAAWIILIIAWPRSESISPLGGAALALGRWAASKVHQHNPAHHLAAIRAMGSVHARSPLGKWTLSAISHGLWAAFNIGCLTLLALLLTAREYTFNWETTILSEDAYVGITRALATVPDAFGFDSPTIDQIRQSEAGASLPTLIAARQAWSWLLFGSIVTYAFLPRAALLCICLIARRRASGQYRLDNSDPGFMRLRNSLMPAAEKRGIVDGDEPPELAAGRSAAEQDFADHTSGGGGRTGDPVIFGLEIESPASAWPPELPGAHWRDLGLIDDRDDRRRVLAELDATEETPRMTLAVCSLTATPVRGLGAFLRQRKDAPGPSRLAVLLTSGQSLRRRGDADRLSLRVEDWHRLATDAGIAPDLIIELDLDNLTESSLTKLAELVGADLAQPLAQRHIEDAFALITTSIADWGDNPSTERQAELHREIAKLYRDEAKTWREMLHLPADLDAGDVTSHLQLGADRVVRLLPDRLKRSPKWLAAGAASGALGCVAASLLISPVAIGALPMWSAIGAAIAAVAQPGPRPRNDDKPSKNSGDKTPGAGAVRSAALFTLLLELQGRDEPTISRLLDKTLPDDDAQIIAAANCSAWLDEIRHRLDLALASEAAS